MLSPTKTTKAEQALSHGYYFGIAVLFASEWVPDSCIAPHLIAVIAGSAYAALGSIRRALNTATSILHKAHHGWAQLWGPLSDYKDSNSVVVAACWPLWNF